VWPKRSRKLIIESSKRWIRYVDADQGPRKARCAKEPKYRDERKMLLRVLFRCCLIVPLAWGAVVQISYADTAAASLDGLKQSVLSALRYDAATIEVTATSVQVVVTVINSDLNGSLVTHHERETEAADIVGAVAVTLAKSPELSAIQAIHVDYVARQPGSTHSDVVDAIDFRRNSQGKFELHKT
jgi:hypothetical protein